MDGETPKGCEPAPQSGGSEGQAGGSVPPGNSQVHSGQSPSVFRKHQDVYIRWRGQKWNGRVVDTTTMPDGETVYIVDPLHGSPFQVKAADLMDKHVEDLRVWNEKREEKRIEYGRLIELWNAGVKTNKALATALDITIRGAGAKVRSAIKWNLIEPPPKPPDDSNSDNPPVLQTDGGSSPN